MRFSICCLIALITASPIDTARIQLQSLSNRSESSNCASFHGRIDSLQGIFYLPPGCPAFGETPAVRFEGWNAGRVYWESESNVEREIVRDFTFTKEETLAMGEQAQMVLSDYGMRGEGLETSDGKVVILATTQGRLIQLSNDAALVELTSSPSYRFNELVHISPRSLPLPSSSSFLDSDPSTQSTVSEYARQRIINQLAALRFSPSISNLLAKLPLEQLYSDIRFLSGEDQSTANTSWNTRHSMSRGGMRASSWLLEQFQEMGMKNCSREFYLEGFSPNVVCYLEGIDSESSTVLLSAHYDGRGVSSFTPFSPGKTDTKA